MRYAYPNGAARPNPTPPATTWIVGGGFAHALVFSDMLGGYVTVGIEFDWRKFPRLAR